MTKQQTQKTTTIFFKGCTLEELRLLFKYDPETGKIFNQKTGKEIGYNNGKGYLRTQVKDNKVVLHQLAWVLVYGEVPSMDIDHINGNKMDNRLDNLRLVSRGANLQNSKVYRGFWWNKLAKKWSVAVKINYKAIHIGYFDTELDARAAYIRAKRELHPYAVF